MTDRDLTGKTSPHHANALSTCVTGEIVPADAAIQVDAMVLH
ncbi:hypothetical protein [Hyphomonas oceanitis]|nr:hypothetical protein [Hyphomonas oceanitis]